SRNRIGATERGSKQAGGSSSLVSFVIVPSQPQESHPHRATLSRKNQTLEQPPSPSADPLPAALPPQSSAAAAPPRFVVDWGGPPEHRLISSRVDGNMCLPSCVLWDLYQHLSHQYT
ncbi:hypothetical protein EJB05_03314, partial [Eragrostis curvula]